MFGGLAHKTADRPLEGPNRQEPVPKNLADALIVPSRQ